MREGLRMAVLVAKLHPSHVQCLKRPAAQRCCVLTRAPACAPHSACGVHVRGHGRWRVGRGPTAPGIDHIGSCCVMQHLPFGSSVHGWRCATKCYARHSHIKHPPGSYKGGACVSGWFQALGSCPTRLPPVLNPPGCCSTYGRMCIWLTACASQEKPLPFATFLRALCGVLPMPQTACNCCDPNCGS